MRQGSLGPLSPIFGQLEVAVPKERGMILGKALSSIERRQFLERYSSKSCQPTSSGRMNVSVLKERSRWAAYHKIHYKLNGRNFCSKSQVIPKSSGMGMDWRRIENCEISPAKFHSWLSGKFY